MRVCLKEHGALRLAPWLLSAVLLDLLGVEFLRCMEADEATEIITQTGIKMLSSFFRVWGLGLYRLFKGV